jgi:transcriptional regulator with XRE-family HTH domain
MDAIAWQFAENLVITRKRARVSQEELGFRADLHRTEIGQLERGHRLPRIDTVVKLAGALSVEPGDLMVGMKWKPGGVARPGKFKAAHEQPEASQTQKSH